jgi:hypothetical protein
LLLFSQQHCQEALRKCYIRRVPPNPSFATTGCRLEVKKRRKENFELAYYTAYNEIKH